MRYTYGYIKEAILSKLDIDQQEALEQGLINKIPYYANEAMTQICSAVKPKHIRIQFNVVSLENAWKMSLNEMARLALNLPQPYYVGIIRKPSILNRQEKVFWEYFENLAVVGAELKMPDNFIAFDDGETTFTDGHDYYECDDTDLEYASDYSVIFFKEGIYTLYYKARWYFFTSTTKDTDILDVPIDVLECIPSYVVSQLYKIDDEVKAQVYRSEFELLLSRIDDTYLRKPSTIKIGGGW